MSQINLSEMKTISFLFYILMTDHSITPRRDVVRNASRSQLFSDGKRLVVLLIAMPRVVGSTTTQSKHICVMNRFVLSGNVAMNSGCNIVRD